MQHYIVALSGLLLVAGITSGMPSEERSAQQEPSKVDLFNPSNVDLDECGDNDQYCSQWMVLGECEKNSAWMNIYCKQSCKQCGDLNVCNDHSENCETWAKLGQCQSNPDYMLLYCEKACGVGEC